jgi:hypothetical protein
MTEETVVTPEVQVVDQEQQKVEQQERVYTDVEQRALDQGWKPLEDWEGDPADHRSAKEYIDRGELLGKIKSQSSEIREVKQMLATLSEHNKKVFLAGKEEALKELKSQRVIALKEDEVEVAVELEDRIREAEKIIDITKAAPVPKPSEGPTPAFEAWLEKSQWYANDEGMRAWADGEGLALGKSGKRVTEQDVYDHLSKKVKEVFPQKFQRTSAQSPDGDGRKGVTNRTAKGGDKFEQLLSEMPEHQARTARNLVASGLLTKEKYVEDFDAIGGR